MAKVGATNCGTIDSEYDPRVGKKILKVYENSHVNSLDVFYVHLKVLCIKFPVRLSSLSKADTLSLCRMLSVEHTLLQQAPL